MEIRILGILLLSAAVFVTPAHAQLKRLGISGLVSRFKRPYAPSLEGSQGYSYAPQPTFLPVSGSSYNNQAPNLYAAPQVYAPVPAAAPLSQYPNAGRPFGMPEEKPRFPLSGFTYKIPVADPPPPPVRSSYVSKPFADYVVRFNNGNHPSQVTVINRRPQPPPASPSFYGTGALSPSYPSGSGPTYSPPPPPRDTINVHPPLTSVYVISASAKDEGSKQAFIGLHKDPVFGSTPEPGVIKPLQPDVVYTPNQGSTPTDGKGEQFKPMYIFGPVFYPKSNGDAKDNVESESSASSVLKSPSDVANITTTTTTTSTTTTSTTPAPSSSETVVDDSKDADSDTISTSSDETSSSGSGSKGGGRGIIGVIKNLLGVDEAADDLDDTNSRADNDKDEKVDKNSAKGDNDKKDNKVDKNSVSEDENDKEDKVDISSDGDDNDNSTTKGESEVEHAKESEADEAQEEKADKPDKLATERVKKTPFVKPSAKKNKNPSEGFEQKPAKNSSVEIEEKKQNDDEVNIDPPKQQLDSEMEHEHFGHHQAHNHDDPDPIVGPLQIGFIRKPPSAMNPYGPPMTPYFYPAGIPLYNDRPPLNPFSPTGTGYSHEHETGFEADHSQSQLHTLQQQSPPSQLFTQEMIKHEQDKIRQNFEQQRNPQNFEQQSHPSNFEQQRIPHTFNQNQQQQENTEQGQKIEENDGQSQLTSNHQLQDVGKIQSAVDEHGITVDNKREVSPADFDHTNSYDEQSTATSTNDAHSVTSTDNAQDTTTAYADMKHENGANYYRDVSPASQTSSQLHVDQEIDFKSENSPSTIYNRYVNQPTSEDDLAFSSTVSPIVQSSYASVSTRKPFPNFNQRYQGFRAKNRNYVAPTTYRPSYPRTPSTEQPPVEEELIHNDDENSLDDHKDSSATLYNSINYEQSTSTNYEPSSSSSGVTPAIHVEPYGERGLSTDHVEDVVDKRQSSYGSRISDNK